MIKKNIYKYVRESIINSIKKLILQISTEYIAQSFVGKSHSLFYFYISIWFLLRRSFYSAFKYVPTG